jgi:hypothetical protein
MHEMMSIMDHGKVVSIRETGAVAFERAGKWSNIMWRSYTKLISFSPVLLSITDGASRSASSFQSKSVRFEQSGAVLC